MRIFAVFSVAACITFLASCTRTQSSQEPQLELSVYSGVRGLVSIGDTEEKVLSQSHWKPSRFDADNPALLEALKISHVLFFKEVGVRVYIRNGRAVLLEVQEPFKGRIQGQSLQVFHMKRTPASDSWGQRLTEMFGAPEVRAGGGSFNSQALYYRWGDISFNANGPNEIAIYRDPAIREFRHSHFGRKLNLFGSGK